MAARLGLFVLALSSLVAAAWELYKLIGPEDGGADASAGTSCPRANDTAMPHVWDMGERFTDAGEPHVGPADLAGRALRGVVLVPPRRSSASLLGTAVGIGLADA